MQGSSLYADPGIRNRLAEFLGGEDLAHATALYVTRADGVAYDTTELRPPAELPGLLARDMDMNRSLADAESLVLHLDVEYVNFDSAAEAHVDPWRAFDLQEPVVKVIEAMLLGWGIRPLHVITGQGHHFVWRVRRDSRVAATMARLCPAPELIGPCLERVPAVLAGKIDTAMLGAFACLSMVMEFMAHRVKMEASSACLLPVEITAVHVGPSVTTMREIVSLDISEYGDALHTRMIRMPFTRYLKPWVTGLATTDGMAAGIPRICTIPLHEIDVRQALVIRQVESGVRDLARRACVRIPEQAAGTARMLDDYLASPLRRFHEYFYSQAHDPERDWPNTYGRTCLADFPPCVRHILTFPNDLLLKPAGMQLVTRSLLAAGWHPRHIAGLLRSKFTDKVFGWGVNWNDYEPGTRADFYVRLFAGLHATGLDRLLDFNCKSTQEKGFCFVPPGGGCSLEPSRSLLLERRKS